MSVRVLNHILFWSLFVTLYAIKNMLFAGPSDLAYPPALRFFRFLFSELVFLPWKLIPFYFVFYYLLPKYFKRRKYGIAFLLFTGVLLICVYGYRSMVTPLSGLLYGETPDFKVYGVERLLYTLTDIIPALGLAATVKLLKGRIAFQKKEEALRLEKQIAELNFLKAQTNPHFLFNTLNNLYGLARKNDPHTAASILKLSNMMRYILHECNAPTVPVSSEIKIIEDFIELERLRYNDRLQVRFDRSIDEPTYPIAPLILLSFVENAFKHGAGEARFGITIDLSLQLKDGRLQFYIRNPYEPDEKDSVHEGTGLKNVKRQLELIYGEGTLLELLAEDRTFTVHLNLDLRNHEA